MNSPKPGLIAAALLIASPALCLPNKVSDAQLLEAGKSTLASEIEPGLPDESVEIWLRPLVGNDADWNWGLNDCGEQTGVPDVDRDRDIPICAELEVIDGSRTIIIYYLVGFSSTGLVDARNLYFVGVSELGTIKTFDGFSSLAAHLRIEQEEYTEAELHFASLLDDSIREKVVSQMTDSGLAPTDAESVADIAVLGYAKCSVSTLGQIDNPTADALLMALDERLSAEDLDTRLQEVDDSFFADFIIEWSSLTNSCRKDVDTKLGIPLQG